MKRVVTAVLIGVLIKKIIVKIANKTVQLKIDSLTKRFPSLVNIKKLNPVFQNVRMSTFLLNKARKIVSTIG